MRGTSSSVEPGMLRGQQALVVGTSGTTRLCPDCQDVIRLIHGH
jgi:hypothetical protein